MGYLKLLR